MDISNTIIANSDQINAADLGQPITVTIREVTKGSADQPVYVHLKEVEGKTYRPSKSMRRVMVKLWGADASTYAGNRITLYNDPSVKWAGQPVGGIRISHASGIEKPAPMIIQVARGKTEKLTIQPLQDAAPAQSAVPSISQETWAEIQSLATEKGVENIGAWVAEQIGRQLQSWQEITTEEAAKLHQVLTQEDGE